MSASAVLTQAVVDITVLLADIEQGRIEDAEGAAKRLLALAFGLAPVALADSLTPEARIWADLSVDIAENTKLDAAIDAAEEAKFADK